MTIVRTADAGTGRRQSAVIRTVSRRMLCIMGRLGACRFSSVVGDCKLHRTISEKSLWRTRPPVRVLAEQEQFHSIARFMRKPSSLLVAAFASITFPFCAVAQYKMQTPAGEAPGPWLFGTIGVGKG